MGRGSGGDVGEGRSAVEESRAMRQDGAGVRCMGEEGVGNGRPVGGGDGARWR